MFRCRKWKMAGIPLLAASQIAAVGAPAPAASGVAALSATDCLTAAIYYEARSESEDGQRAVAQVVLNRVRHPAYPKSVCGVVFQGYQRASGCQFSFTCDGSLAHRPRLAGWARARAIAAEVLGGRSSNPVGDATHYHARSVLPYWANSFPRLGTIGSHIFYGSGARLQPRASFAAADAQPRSEAKIERAVAAVRETKSVETQERSNDNAVAVQRVSARVRRAEPAPQEQGGVRVHRGTEPALD